MGAASDDQEFDLRQLLAAVEDAPPVGAIDVFGRELARMVGATRVALLIANFSGDAVVRMSHEVRIGETHDGENERAEPIRLSGSAYESVLFGQELVVEQSVGRCQVLVPVSERGDAIGVLELTLPSEPDSDVIEYLHSAAHALAYVLIASRRHTDLFEWAQRDRPFSLSAEIQRRLLPSSYSVETNVFTLAGWLEPASEVGGDTFDYSVDREYLYVSITDAMGHSTASALLATLTVGSLRNSRRLLASPSEQADLANDALHEGDRQGDFVTGLVLRVRLADGQVEAVNAGHPPPFLLRYGKAEVLDISPHPPFGIADAAYTDTTIQLQSGDRLLLVTDGFLERNATTLDIRATLEGSRERHPREIVRELADNVLNATDWNLRDDATVVCVDWYGADGRRAAHGGASQERATAP
jgi:serine phosphatase RsbU (regulator of sigma subunit)